MKPSSYLSSSFLDMLFEGKNKLYGAYELRLHYEQRLRKALISMGAFVIIITLLFRFTLLHKKERFSPPLLHKTLTLSQVETQKPDISPIPPPKLPEAAKLKPQTKYTPFDVVKDALVQPQEEPPDLKQIRRNAIGTQTLPGNINGENPGLSPGNHNGVTAGINNHAAKIFISVEQMPRFHDTKTDDESNAKVMAFLSAHIHYPQIAQENGIQGTVVIRFVVGPDGAIRDIQLMGKDPGGGLKEEALRVIGNMPKWIPGKQNGRNVSVWFTLPVRFTLR